MEDKLKHMTFGQYLDRYVNRDFFEEYMYPSCNIILSCSRDSVEGYPAYIVLKVLLATSRPGGRSIMKLTGGINTIIPILVEPIETLKFNTRIASVAHSETTDTVSITDHRGDCQEYDRVIFATEAECIPYLIQDQPAQDAAVFRYFKYEPVHIVIHSNTEQCLSGNTSYWSLLNIINSPDKSTLPQISLLMNNFINAPLSKHFIQTLNPTPKLLQEAHIISETRMKRVVFDLHVQDHLTKLDAIQGQRRMYYCGSYAVYGSNLLEEGLISAMRVARMLGVEVPWEPASQC